MTKHDLAKLPEAQWRRYLDWKAPWEPDLVLRERRLRIEKVIERREEYAEKEARLMERLKGER